MADISDVYVKDLTAETLDSLNGSEGVVGFDTVEGKQIPVNVLSRYAVEKQAITVNGSNKTVQVGLNDLYGITDDLAASIAAAREDISWLEIANDMRTGKTGKYNIGDTITEPWTDTALNRSYDNPWRVNHFESVETEGGITLPGMWLQNVYAHSFGVQFSHQRAFLKCPSGLAAGTYYVTLGASWGTKDAVADTSWNFTLTKAVPAGGRLAGFYQMPDTLSSTWQVHVFAADGITELEVANISSGASGTNLGTLALSTRNGNLNSMQETGYGWNNWAHSAIRQYLNSDAAAGEWWEPQDEWDIRPDQLATKPGFLTGLPEGMKAALVPVKTVTYANTVQDGGNAEITYDRVSLISLQQAYIVPQIQGEGEAHDYWKQALGTETPFATGSNHVSDALKHYAVENHASAQAVRLRSAGRGSAYYAWSMGSGGCVNYGNASNAYRFAPLVFIG